jgi:hypothetical protein
LIKLAACGGTPETNEKILSMAEAIISELIIGPGIQY